MHIGEIETSIVLDMASPTAALCVSKFLLSLLASDGSALRGSLRCIAPMVVTESQSGSTAWRMDTCTVEEEPSLDSIISWIETTSGADQDASWTISSLTPCSLPSDPQSDSTAMPSRGAVNRSKKSSTTLSVSYVSSHLMSGLMI